VAATVPKGQSGSPPSFTAALPSGPWLFIDALVVAAVAIVAAAFFYISPDVREWIWQALGYGWAPVGLWIIAAVFTLRYAPRSLFRYWRRWVVAAAAVALSIGVLSYFSPSDGLLEEVTMGGLWGIAVGGPRLFIDDGLPLGLAKMLAIVALVPLALYPRAAGPLYSRGLARAWRWLVLAAVYTYLGIRRAASAFDGAMDRAKEGRARRQEERARKRADAEAVRNQIEERTIVAQPIEIEPDGSNVIADIWNNATAPAPESEYDNGYAPPWESAPSTFAPPASPVGPTGPVWRLPSVETLAPPESMEASQEALREMGKKVEEALADQGVRVEVTDIKAGPRVVQFGLSPGWVAKRGGENKEGGQERSRVKVQSITSREKDLALALMTPYLRVEAPIPGTALVGLEVPVPTPTKVHLRAVLETGEFRKTASKGGLPIAMGQDTGGAPVALDLASLPHMLIAGATGSGKSVQINSIIASFLLTKTPEQLRLLMVDPKRVELTPFNGIPHLVQPVIVEAEEVTDSLKGLNREMIRRYKQMEELGVRNLEAYNGRSEEKMPFLVLIVDELADLMMVAGFEVEQNLVRLAQLGRAAGIHLLLATQRPSVNVVTGLLKANVPARCAFAVSGQVDSRVILDSAGAEKLMGKGDALILHKESPKAQRMQGALVYDEEVEALVKFWQEQEGPPVAPINLLTSDDDEEAEALGLDAGQMDQARDLAARNPNLSVSILQRRLKVGGNRAEEILEELEEEGYLTPR